MLRHQPILTYDVDLWVEDKEENLSRCETALVDLDAEWGATEQTWQNVKKLPAGWLTNQSIYSLMSPHGALDIFRQVAGLSDWHICRQRAVESFTGSGTPYPGLSDDDMLLCQLALSDGEQKKERIRVLKDALERRQGDQP